MEHNTGGNNLNKCHKEGRKPRRPIARADWAISVTGVWPQRENARLKRLVRERILELISDEEVWA